MVEVGQDNNFAALGIGVDAIALVGVNWLFRFRESIRTWGCRWVDCSDFAGHILTWSHSFPGILVCLKELSRLYCFLDSENLPKIKSIHRRVLVGIIKDNQKETFLLYSSCFTHTVISTVYDSLNKTHFSVVSELLIPVFQNPWVWRSLVKSRELVKGSTLLTVERCWKVRGIGILPLSGQFIINP